MSFHALLHVPSLSLSLLSPLPSSMFFSLAGGDWEKFEDSRKVSKKILSSVSSSEEPASSGAVCAADAMTSNSEWMALDDSRHKEVFGK